jgi:hypothetical protein
LDTRESYWIGQDSTATQIGDLLTNTTLGNYTPTATLLPGTDMPSGGGGAGRVGLTTSRLDFIVGQRLQHVIIMNLPQTTTERVWLSLASDTTSTASTMAGSDTPALSYFGFRFSTNAADANWKAVSDNGSGVPQITDTGVAVDTAKSQVFRFEQDFNSATVRFYINDSLVATHSTTVPALGTALGIAHVLRELAAAVKNFRFSIVKSKLSFKA